MIKLGQISKQQYSISFGVQIAALFRLTYNINLLTVKSAPRRQFAY